MVPEVDSDGDEHMAGSIDQGHFAADDNTDSIETPDSLVSLAVLPNRHVAIGSMDHNIYIATIDDSSRVSLRCVLEGHNDTVTDFAYHAPSRQLASGSYDGTVRLWNCDTFEELESIEGPSSGIDKLVWDSTSDHIVAACEDGSLWIWRRSDGLTSSAIVCSGHNREITSVHISNGTVISCSLDGFVMVWDILSGVCKLKIRVSNGEELRSMTIHPHNNTAVVGTESGKLGVISLDSGRVAGLVQAHEQGSSIEVVCFDRSGAFLCSGSTDGGVKVRDNLRLLGPSRHDTSVSDGAVSAISWHESSNLFFCCTSTGKVQAFSPLSHSTILTASDDGAFRSFDVELSGLE
jgi:WD40 repeat protein